VRAASVIITVY